MKKNIFINACFLLFLLFCFFNSAEATEPADTTRVYSARSCVSIFENQTVSSSRSMVGCDSLIVRGVTVSDVGNLTLTAPDYVVLYGAFEVVQGGTLSINEKEEPLIFEFSYDAAGNRILRQAQTVQ